MSRPGKWRIVRRIWITLGLSATAVFAVWSMLAYRASGEALRALDEAKDIEIRRSGELIRFRPTGSVSPTAVGLLFLPGALVDPVAYAPLARAAAEAGYPAYIVSLPWRGAFGGAESPELFGRIDSIFATGEAETWVVAGHSRGAVVASTLVAHRRDGVSGLILIGTSHPRDVNLSELRIPVAKIAGTRDGLATPQEVQANASLLPPSTQWTWIDGGNHSQFGWYGFQPGDRRATVSRAAQLHELIETVVGFLRQVDRQQVEGVKWAQ